MNDLKKIGRYNVQSLLGEGAMGSVFRAVDPNIGRTVAIKIVKIDINDLENQDTAGFRERFQQEARISGNLNHPNIVAVYDVDQHDGMPYIAMEYVEGQTLAQYIRSDRKLTPGEMVNLLFQLAGALDFAHGRGVVHRDLKPANIMVSREGVPKIMDFGIAKMSGSNLTQTGVFLGTPSYSSPEQIKEGQVDWRSDIFSFGILACEVLTGKLPFPGKTIHNILFRIANEPPEFRKDLDHLGIPVPRFHEVFERVLHKEPERRYQSASAFAQDLLDIMNLGANDRQRLSQTTSHLATVAANAGLAKPLARSEFETNQGFSERTVVAHTGGTSSPSIPVKKSSGTGIVVGLFAALITLGAVGFLLYKQGYLDAVLAKVNAPKEEPLPVVDLAPKALAINTSPAGAQVLEGANPLGITPFSYEWAGQPGETKKLTVKLDGYQDQTVSLAFDQELKPQYDLILVRKPTRRSISCTPSDATITVNGQVIAGNPAEYPFVFGTSYEISWSKDGFLSTRLTYTEGESDPSLLAPTLPAKPAPGTLVVDSDISDLAVFVDGLKVATPASLEPGTYKVRLSSERYYFEETRTVRVQSKERSHLSTPMVIKIPKLDFIGGYVNVKINGRLVRSNGQPDTTPMINLEVAAGENRFEFLDPSSGKMVLKKTIDIKRSENLVLTADP